MSVLKKISLILFILMIENINAEAQFSYTHSDETMITCNKAPIQMAEYEGSIEAKYVEVVNKQVMVYGTSANVSNPKNFTRIDVETIALEHIAFDQDHFAVLVEGSEDDKPMTIMFIYTSPQVNQTYLNENGVKSKESPISTTVASIEFPTHTLAKDFVYEVISNLAPEAQKEAETTFEDIYYGMVGEMNRQQDMLTRKKNQEEQAKQEIKQNGTVVSLNGREIYMNMHTYYQWNGEPIAIGVRNATRYNFGDIEYLWDTNKGTISKNRTVILYIKNSGIYKDQACNFPYITFESGDSDTFTVKYNIYQDGKKVGECHKKDYSITYIEMACLMHYMGL